MWGQCLIPSSKKGILVRGVFRPLDQENLGFSVIVGVLMMMSRCHWGSHHDVMMESSTPMISGTLRLSTTRT